MDANLRPARIGAAPVRLLIIAMIVIAQAAVVGMGWWSGSRELLTEVVDEYSHRVEAAAQETASGIALAISKVDEGSIAPGTPGGERVRSMLRDLELPGNSVVTVVTDEGEVLHRLGAVPRGAPAYTASASLAKFGAEVRVRSTSSDLLHARDAATGAINRRVLLGGSAIVLLTGVVGISLIGLNEHRLEKANRVLSRAYEAQAKDLIAAREGMIVGLAKLADFRDTDTGQHLDRICEYSVRLAQAARPAFHAITDTYIERLRLASTLHDIGKVGIPDSILLKPGKLEPQERAIIERHTVFGADTLCSIRKHCDNDPLLDMSVDIAIAHHERWDGGGYPYGISGEAIPLAARIVAIVDVYDAITSVRVYKDAMTHEEAVEILSEGRGTQFDPVLLDAFLSIADEINVIRSNMQSQRTFPGLQLAA